MLWNPVVAGTGVLTVLAQLLPFHPLPTCSAVCLVTAACVRSAWGTRLLSDGERPHLTDERHMRCFLTRLASRCGAGS